MFVVNGTADHYSFFRIAVRYRFLVGMTCDIGYCRGVCTHETSPLDNKTG